MHATGQRLTLSFAWIVACAVALVVAAPAPAQTSRTRAPVQIAREVNLQRAAQAGVVKLESKGGGEGDAVSPELTGKQIPGDVTVTVRAEFTVPDRLDEENRAAVRDGLAEIAAKTEAELNRTAYRSSGGDTIRFKVQYQYRDPNTPPDLGYHQVRLVNPTRDLPEPDPDYHSNVEGLGKPNVSEEALDATFTFGIWRARRRSRTRRCTWSGWTTATATSTAPAARTTRSRAPACRRASCARGLARTSRGSRRRRPGRSSRRT